jgi:mannose-6-phosphate isomerase-like protein (cupin superfamily)
MKLIDYRSGEIVKDDGGVVGRKIYDSAEAQLIHIEVAPGGAIAPHVTPVDMEFYVLEGRGIFILGEESREAGAGTLIPSPRGVPHGMKNPGPAPLKVLAIKNPRP